MEHPQQRTNRNLEDVRWNPVLDKWLAQAKAVVGTNPAETRRCIEEAEACVQTDCDLQDVADAWMTLLKDADRARALFPRMKADCGYQIVGKIRGYHKLFGGDIKLWLREAEGKLTHSTGLRCIAMEWEYLLGQECREDYNRCMVLAEKYAKDTMSWTSCADGWRDIGNHSRAIHCIQQGETAAQEMFDWLYCGKEWAKSSPEKYRDRIVRCLRNAETLCNTTEHMRFVAAQWKIYLGENEYARLLPLAEKMAVIAEDWRICARAWLKECGNVEAYKRCMNKAG